MFEKSHLLGYDSKGVQQLEQLFLHWLSCENEETTALLRLIRNHSLNGTSSHHTESQFSAIMLGKPKIKNS